MISLNRKKRLYDRKKGYLTEKRLSQDEEKVFSEKKAFLLFGIRACKKKKSFSSNPHLGKQIMKNELRTGLWQVVSLQQSTFTRGLNGRARPQGCRGGRRAPASGLPDKEAFDWRTHCVAFIGWRAAFEEGRKQLRTAIIENSNGSARFENSN